jgi:hypothetical protein
MIVVVTKCCWNSVVGELAVAEDAEHVRDTVLGRFSTW